MCNDILTDHAFKVRHVRQDVVQIDQHRGTQFVVSAHFSRSRAMFEG
jgi:hypothetical protein